MASQERNVVLHESASGLALVFTWSAHEHVEPVVRFIGARGKGIPASVIGLAHGVFRDPSQLGREEIAPDAPPPAPPPRAPWWRRLFRRNA